MLTETELIGKAKQGDTRAFEELMRKHQGKIYNLGLKLLRNKEDAADMLQETFIKAYQALPRFEQKSALSTWLYRIAANFAFMKLRKKNPKKLSLDEIKEASTTLYEKEIKDWSANPQAHLQNQDLKAVLDGAIGLLPSKYKTVFMLHDVEGLPIAKVGEVLSLSVPAVKSRIHRSRLFLRERLSKYFEPNEN